MAAFAASEIDAGGVEAAAEPASGTSLIGPADHPPPRQICLVQLKVARTLPSQFELAGVRQPNPRVHGYDPRP